MKIAACQAPLEATLSIEKIIDFVRDQIRWCESNEVEILCCPEGLLGGLADYVDEPASIAIETGGLQKMLAPLRSDSVTTILGFTEIDNDGRLYNSATVFHKGSVHGIYRKLHPAINRSVYTAGDSIPVFKIGTLIFGIVICNDSNFDEPVRKMAERGARVIFIPTNNGLPAHKTGPKFVEHTRKVDIARATENNVYIVRADVAGNRPKLVAYGTSEIVSPEGEIIASARQFESNLVVAEITFTSQSGAPQLRGSVSVDLFSDPRCFGV